MTLDKLIARLEQLRDQIGGDCEVTLQGDDGAAGFSVRYRVVDDPRSETGTGCEVYIVPEK
jgi:hypothetical protein